MSNNGSSPLVLWYNQLGMNDVDRVGGKNASLGEMITNLSGMGVSVPNGFATTADAFNQFLDQSGVNQRIYALLDETDIDDVSALAKAGAQIRQWIIDTPFQSELENAIRDAYDLLSADDAEASFAVRSSATAEDMPDASFAGQQETFLNVQGFDAVLVAVKHVFASLFNDRAISYRVHQGYDHRGVALSAGVQRMVRSDLASSGVMFSIDTESGFDQVVFIDLCMGFGRDGGAGRGEPGRILRPQTDAGRWPSGDRAPHHGVEKRSVWFTRRPRSTVNRCVSKMCRRRSAIFSR
ncbi:Phosphoenolpyruvate synthase [Klebsiella pneumoniae IS10]|nr:Phosphoenolpyruvate synthase [Klebsiella pneumoniae IS10]